MSTHVYENSVDFGDIEQKMKSFINSKFRLRNKCQYEAFALKLEFSKIIVEIRQIIEDYKDQEFPDIYEHLRMIRTVNQTFHDWMMLNVGNISETVGFNKVGSPRANSTPAHKIESEKFDEKFKNTQTSLVTPLSKTYEGTYRAVRNFHDMLNQLQHPCTSYGSSKQNSFVKKPKFNVSRTQLPRRRMNFSKSFLSGTPQTQ
ncbi:unnamed protein product [Chironomus riparius]|uniref:Uncharacterized protein n=1 Tax=Chironomus riparius TaxID=315576 RepID=A0A9N9RSG9_9DIPT|nr:unnamed protein product [Chironomus riparius]